MAYIDNTQTKKEIEDAIRGNSVSNLAPSKVIDSIQPVINVNPKDYRRVNIIKSTAVAGTVYTTPSNKDFYLTNTHLSASTNQASQTGTVSISVLPKGETSTIIINAIRLLTTVILDSDHSEIFESFERPILLERNSTITLAITNTTAARAIIFGYEVD